MSRRKSKSSGGYSPTGRGQVSRNFAGSFNGILSKPAQQGMDFSHLDIAAPSGRVYSQNPVSDPIFTATPQTIVIGFNAFNGFNFSNLGAASSEPGVGEVQSFMQALYYRIVSIVQSTRIAPTFTLTTQTDWVNTLNTISQCYITLRALQAILECGNLNNSVGKMIQAIEAQRPLLTSCLRYLQQFCLPQPLCVLLDRMVGVFQRDGNGVVLITMFEAGFTATTMPDLTSSTDVGTILSTTLSLLQGIVTTTEGNTIMDILRIAYGNPLDLSSKPMITDPGCFDVIRTMASTEWDSTSAKQFNAPVVDAAANANNPVPILAKRGVSYPQEMLTLLRVPVVGSAIAAGHELLGFLAWLSSGGTHFGVYGAAGTITKITSIQAAATTGITDTDLVTYFFPWAGPCSFEVTPASMLLIGSQITEWDKVYSNVPSLCDETMVLLEQVFIGGMKPITTSASYTTPRTPRTSPSD